MWVYGEHNGTEENYLPVELRKSGYYRFENLKKSKKS
jgi:hypothetical protein